MSETKNFGEVMGQPEAGKSLDFERALGILDQIDATTNTKKILAEKNLGSRYQPDGRVMRWALAVDAPLTSLAAACANTPEAGAKVEKYD